MASTTMPVTHPVTNNCAGRPIYLPKIHVIDIMSSQKPMANRRITTIALPPSRFVILIRL